MLRLGCGALLLCGGASVAVAQPTLTITPKADVVYDTNYARSSAEVAEERGLHRSEVRFTPALEVALEAPVGRQAVFLTGELGYDFYMHNQALNRERLALTAGSRLQFSRCSGTISGSFSRRQSDVADFVDVERVKNAQTTTVLALDGRCGGDVGFSPIFGASRAWTDNSDDLRDYGNSVSTSVNGGIAYGRPSFGEIALTAAYTDVEYPDRTDFLPDDSGGYAVWSVGGRFTRRISTRIGGSVGLYYSTVDPDDDGEKFSGITADASVDAAVGSATKIFLSAGRAVQPTNLIFGDYSIVTNYAARVQHGVGPRLMLSTGADGFKRNIHGEGLVPIELLTSEKRFHVFGRADYTVGRNASIGVELGHEVRDAHPNIFDYSSTRAMLGVRYALKRGQ